MLDAARYPANGFPFRLLGINKEELRLAQTYPDLQKVLLARNPGWLVVLSYNNNIGHLSIMQDNPIVPVLPAAPVLTQGGRERLNAVMASARSASTRRCYASQWRVWQAWAGERGQPDLPGDPAAVATFLLDRADAGASIATVRLARAAIGAFHRDGGHPDPTDNVGVRRVMAGLSRTFARPQRQAAALTRDVQVAIQATAHFPRLLPSGLLEEPDKARARAVVDIAIVAVMRDGLLRRSEAAALTWDDVEFFPDGSARGHSEEFQDGPGP